MLTLWRLHNWWLDQLVTFANSPLDHKEDTLLGLICFAVLCSLPHLLDL
ncbi:MAG: hypothetical protein KGZ68_15145 [Dechloromonas sp.]|nr:hypothetical protein [Dechloromonas sp.]